MGPASSAPRGSMPCSKLCCIVATTSPPLVDTWTTGAVAEGARPASGTTFCAPAGTTMPVAPGALTRPVSVKMSRLTVASTDVGLESSTRLVWPSVVAPATSQLSADASAQEAAARPERSGLTTFWIWAPPNSGGLVAPRGVAAVRASGAWSGAAAEASGVRFRVWTSGPSVP